MAMIKKMLMGIVVVKVMMMDGVAVVKMMTLVTVVVKVMMMMVRPNTSMVFTTTPWVVVQIPSQYLFACGTESGPGTQTGSLLYHKKMTRGTLCEYFPFLSVMLTICLQFWL